MSRGSVAVAILPEAYKLSDIVTGGDPEYFGFLKADGTWYIMKATGGTYRYAQGSGDYSTNWTGRAGLTYGYYSATF